MGRRTTGAAAGHLVEVSRACASVLARREDLVPVSMTVAGWVSTALMEMTGLPGEVWIPGPRLITLHHLPRPRRGRDHTCSLR